MRAIFEMREAVDAAEDESALDELEAEEMAVLPRPRQKVLFLIKVRRAILARSGA
jgi:hypothetical protein